MTPRCAGPLLAFVLVVLALPAVPAAWSAEDREPAITYLGPFYDQTDFRRLNIGNAGYWFPQFDAPEPVSGRPTGEGALDALPDWVAPFNHWSAGGFWSEEGFQEGDPSEVDLVGCGPLEMLQGCLPGFFFRSFSQDGPAHSAGGFEDWNAFTLPDGRAGLSGAIVDPHTAENSNNTMNRIQLTGDVPETFYLHVVTDNTAMTHDPTRRLQARGNSGPFDMNPGPVDLDDLHQVDTDHFPDDCDLTFNGVADVYTFRYDNFSSGDYLKLRLRGDPSQDGASFGGLLFDVALEPAGPHKRAPRGGPPAVRC